jgi:phage baseplate assembly protein V
MTARVSGVAIAVVTDNRDPERLCRVKVGYPWHDDPRASHWARLAAPMAGANRGVVLIPEIGDEVLVAFERGDLRHPYVVGALWSARAAPPAASADTRLFRSRSGHQLRFDEGAPGAVELSTHDGKRVVMDDDGVRIEDGNGNRLRIDGTSGAIDIASSGKLTIKAASIAIDASGTIEIKAGATLTLRGALVNIN